MKSPETQGEESGPDAQQIENLTAVGRLVSKVAHDINNPLAAIIGFADLLQVERSPEKQLRYAKIISGQAERARKLIENLVMHVRQKEPEKRPVDVNALVSTVLTLREIQLDVEGITLVRSLASNLPQVQLDEHQIGQVLYNVLLNAEQAVASRPGARIVEVETSVEPGGVVVTVRDNGIGMSELVHGRIFEPFFTTRSKGGGSGLGLSVAKEIVDRHQGHISSKSTEGVGTEFSIHLPAATAGRSGAEESSAEELANRTVLVVEDQEYLLDLYAELFGALGGRVLRAQSVTEAIRVCGSDHVDLVVASYRMPNRGTEELHRTLRLTNVLLGKHFIAITVDPLDPKTQAWLEAEGIHSIAKPFTLDEIQGLARRVLRD